MEQDVQEQYLAFFEVPDEQGSAQGLQTTILFYFIIITHIWIGDTTTSRHGPVQQTNNG